METYNLDGIVAALDLGSKNERVCTFEVTKPLKPLNLSVVMLKTIELGALAERKSLSDA